MQTQFIPNSSKSASDSHPDDSHGHSNKKNTLGVLVFLAFIFIFPLFILPFTLDVVSLSKQLFAGAVLLGLFAYILGRFLNSGKLILPTRHTMYALGLFFFTVLLATLLSQERRGSLLGAGFDSLFWVVVCIVVFLLSLMLLNNRKAILWSAVAHIVSICVVVVLSFLHFSGISVFSVFSEDINFNPVGSIFHLGFVVAAAFAALVVFLSLVKIFNTRAKMLLWACTAIFALFLISLNSPTVLVALTLTLILVLPVLFSLNLKKAMGRFSETSSVMLPVVVIAVSVLLVITGARIPTTIDVVEELRLSPEVTYEVTRDSLSGTRFIYGTGPGTFIYNYTENRPVALNETNFWGVQFEQGYSALFTHVSTWGVLGTFAFAALLLLLLRKMFVGSLKVAKSEEGKYNKDNISVGVVAGSFASFLVLGMSLVFYTGNAVIYILLFLSAGVSLSTLHLLGIKQKRSVNMSSSPQLMTISSVSAIVLISFIVGVIYFVGEKYVARAYVASAVNVYQQDRDLNRALAHLQRAIETNSNDDFVLRVATQALYLRLVEISNAAEPEEDVALAQFGEVLDQTIAIAREATNVNPKNRENWVQLAQVFEEVIGIAEGATASASETYDRAVERDPNNPFLHLSKGRAYLKSANFINLQIQQTSQINEGDTRNIEELESLRGQYLDRALSSLETALSLKADYSPAQFLLAQVYSERGDLDRAVEEAEAVVARNPQDPSAFYQLGLFLYEKEEYEEAQDVLENAITLANDQFANARYFLGLTLYELGDVEESLSQFNLIAQDNPENELVVSILENLNTGNTPLTGLEEPGALPPAPQEGMDGGVDDPVLP